MLTPQQIFDKVATHLLKQNAKSFDPNYGCLYRSKDNLKCAVGCLFSDQDYRPVYEGLGIDYLIKYNLLPNNTLKKLFICNKSLLQELQVCHDSVPVCEWKTNLATIAKKFNLEYNIEEN